MRGVACTLTLICSVGFLAATPANAIFGWERGCRGDDGVSYTWHTDFSGVISSHAASKTVGSHHVLAACQNGAIARIYGDDLHAVEKFYKEMYFSDLDYSWVETRARFQSLGYRVAVERITEEFCLCDPAIVSSSKWPEWPKPRQSEDE